MTYREFYNKVKAIEGIDTSMVEFADKAIEALDKKNKNRTGKDSKTAKAMAEWRDKVRVLLPVAPAEGVTAKTLAKALTTDKVEVTTQKITAIVKSFDEGAVDVYEAKDEKKNKVKFYRLAQ